MKKIKNFLSKVIFSTGLNVFGSYNLIKYISSIIIPKQFIESFLLPNLLKPILLIKLYSSLIVLNHMKINNLAVWIPKSHSLIRLIQEQTAHTQTPALIQDPKSHDITSFNFLISLPFITQLLTIDPGQQVPKPTTCPIFIIFLFFINLNGFFLASPHFRYNRS